MSLILCVKCIVFINVYHFCLSEVLQSNGLRGMPFFKFDATNVDFQTETTGSVREQENIYAADGKQESRILDTYSNQLHESPELGVDNNVTPKIRKKKKRTSRKKHNNFNYQFEVATEKINNKKKHGTHLKRKENTDTDKKKKNIKKKFIKKPLRHDEDSSESMEVKKKMSPVDIIVHIKMNDMN